ncbi:MAG: carbohydrate ABC transporter permease [Salinibacterium sp.]|nr:carbohydrate ABC transporter permease [Salinibacterium sp.]
MNRSRVAAPAWGLLKIGITVLIVFPFIFILLLSFRSMTDIFRNPLGLTGNWVPENFERAWNGPPGGTGFANYFFNSIIVVIVAVVVSAVVGAVAAYFVSLLPARWRARVLMIPLIATIIPTLALLIPFFQVFNAWGLINNPVALGVLYAGLSLPMTMLILHAFFVDFPHELREAAAIDGLGHLATFSRIVVPLSQPSLLAVSLLNLIWVWGETQIAIVLMQKAASQTIPVGVLTFQSAFRSELGPIFAGLSLATLPLMAIYFVFNKTISRGVSMGGTFR